MNDFTWEEIDLGERAEFAREITSEMLQQFRAISGDVNPLHQDEKFALEHNFGGVVAFGMLTASLYSTLAGVYLPGKNCLLQSIHADFIAPVYVGDTLTVSGSVAEKHNTVRQLCIKAEIRNQHGKKVGKARIEAGMLA